MSKDLAPKATLAYEDVPGVDSSGDLSTTAWRRQLGVLRSDLKEADNARRKRAQDIKRKSERLRVSKKARQ